MSPPTFTPFALDKLNGGKLLQQINLDLQALQDSMILYAARFGAEAEKSKGVLTVKLQVICTDPGRMHFDFRVDCATTNPKRPADVAMILCQESDEGKAEMVVEKFASHRSGPGGPQLPFADETVDGEVDGETGEVVSGGKKKTPAKT